MYRTILAAGLLWILASGLPLPADSRSEDGLKQGESIGVFYVTKVAGAEDDGVEPGQDLCYRCRYGSSPMVMVFAQATDGKVGELVRQLDAAVAQHEDARLRGLLTLFGDEAGELKEKARALAEQTGATRIPVTIAREAATGPMAYRLSATAPVTIVVAKESQVVRLHTFATDTINVGEVMKEVQQLLN